MYKLFTKRPILGGVSLFLLLTAELFGQTDQSVTGVVRSDTGENLPGITILIEGSKRGTVSDIDGYFSIDVGPDETLLISGIGFVSQSVRVPAGVSQLNIFLQEDTKTLNEVIVVAYGATERKNLTGSITKVNPAEVAGIAVGSIDAQLQGKVAGVQISSPTGVPGETSNVRLRGVTSINASNDPLYVVDGVFVNSNSLQSITTGGKATSPLADINPNDIESIEVLKDAQASALYGSRGANGVILITTKRGGYNQKAKVNFSASTGFAEAIKLWDLATGPQHAELVNEWWVNTGAANPNLNRNFSNRPYRPASEGGRGLPEEQPTYDRLAEIFRTAQIQNYDLSVSGGTSSTKYFIGSGFTTQESIIRPIDFSRFSLRVNLDQDISEKVKVGVSNAISRTFRNQARAGDGPRGGLLQAALHTPTIESPYNEAGELVGRAGFDNVSLLIDHYDVSAISLRYIGNVYAEADLAPGLKFRTSFGADFNNYNETEYWNTFLIEGANGGLATSTQTQFTSLINEQVLSYKNTLGADHTFGFLLGNTLQNDLFERTYAEGRGFPNNDFKLISSAAVTIGNQNWSNNTLVSFFSRVDYNYKRKFLVDFSLRADGSSRFGRENKWGYFPAVGTAYRISDEPFLAQNPVISDLKIKASYGTVGNQNGIGDFAAQGLWSGGAGYLNQPGIAPEQLGNEGLKWERTTQFNLGSEIGLFNDKIGIEFNFYDKYTTDALLQIPLPATTGFGSYWSNAAEISNRGFELSINSLNFQRGDFSWTSNFNIARNVNEIRRLDNPLRFGSRDLILLQEGYPMYSFWVYNHLYVDPQTGDSVYEDINNDGAITTSDRRIVGDLWPDFFGGFSNRFAYKNFDLDVFFAYQSGNLIYNHNAFFGGAGGARDLARVIFADNVNRWQSPGDITHVPRPDGININNYRDGTGRFLEDGSFIRLRSLNLGYTLPGTLSNKIHAERVRVFFNGTNLFLWTKYSGADPESSASSAQNAQGIDLGTPPQPRTLQFGINVVL